ncbi:MAG: recombination mediator RecR [Verrucomicrobia bacterium]|nr:recombination mediator RecR [Verrucomicrobiota bacterium]MDA1065507.1 recombination mediator RecR [Verrucomicrobiota bacterium]
MTPSFDHLVKQLKKLPGLGFRSAERIALHVLVEQPENMSGLVEALSHAASHVTRCERCGNLAEEPLCNICQDDRRDDSVLCVVEQVPDLLAIEGSGSFRGAYHVLHGKLSPIKGIGPDKLNFAALEKRLAEGTCSEMVLALSNDMEGEATCHYIVEIIVGDLPVKVSRIGFGLPSGGGILYADQITLRSAMDGRRIYDS